MIQQEILIVENETQPGGRTGRKSAGNIARELAAIKMEASADMEIRESSDAQR